MVRTWLVLVPVVLLLAGVPAYAQDAPLPDHMFSGGSAALWHADLSGLNSDLALASYPALPLDVPLFGQTTTVGFADGPRVGLTTLTGSVSSSRGERAAELTLTLGAGLFEWGLPAGPDRQVALGIAVGGGYATLNLVDHAPSSFEDALLVSSRAKLDRWLYVIEPSVAAYGKSLPGVAIRLRAGFLVTLSSAWKAGEIAFRDPKLPLSGPSVEVSIMVTLEELLADLLAAPEDAASTTAPQEAGNGSGD